MDDLRAKSAGPQEAGQWPLAVLCCSVKPHTFFIQRLLAPGATKRRAGVQWYHEVMGTQETSCPNLLSPPLQGDSLVLCGDSQVLKSFASSSSELLGHGAVSVELEGGAGRRRAHCSRGYPYDFLCFPGCRFLRLPQYFSQNLRLQLCGLFFHGVHTHPTAQDPQDCQETGAPSARAWEQQHPRPGRPPATGHGALLRVCGP